MCKNLVQKKKKKKNLVQRHVERNVNVKKRQVESIKTCFGRSQRIKSSKYNLYEYLNRKSLII